MPFPNPQPDPRALDAFIGLVGESRWNKRLREIGKRIAEGRRTGRAVAQRHAIEIAIERMRRGASAPTLAERRIGCIAREIVGIAEALPGKGRVRLRAALRELSAGDATLVPLFHLARTAALQRSRGFEVAYPGFAEGAPFDLAIARDGIEAEIACEVVSAEEGRGVHRGDWFRLADRIDPDLQTWLGAHPGRYLLKLTLPDGLSGGAALAQLHERIRRMLEEERRQEAAGTAVLRLDPLFLAGAQADEAGLLANLRESFGPEAHLAVTTAGSGVFVMAARAGRENEVAAAVRRRLAAAAPARLTGRRPGILAVFVEDTDRLEWRGLRERLELEGEARQFLTFPEARPVLAVTCVSRLELFGVPAPDGAPGGELRFRNAAHPAAKAAALAPAVASSV